MSIILIVSELLLYSSQFNFIILKFEAVRNNTYSYRMQNIVSISKQQSMIVQSFLQHDILTCKVSPLCKFSHGPNYTSKPARFITE